MTARIDIPGLTRIQVVRLLAIRKALLARCHNPNCDQFSWYGGRGISVCDDWRLSNMSFVNWAMASGFRPGLEIDRKDNDGNYTPTNCRWVTRSQNCMNRRKRSDAKYSRFKGVGKAGSGRWTAKINSTLIGVFATEEQAARAYDAAALEHFGEFARLNFPAEATP